MSDLKDLFDRWERVWHEGQYDLASSCVADHYIRHDEGGDRTVTREEYIAELAKMKKARPDIRVIVYDHALYGNHAWYRFTMRWTDQENGEICTRAGMQSYRIENGKLAETWVAMQPLGSSWNDPVAQVDWTTPTI